MKISEIFSSEGKYSRYQYNITEFTIDVLITGLIILVALSPWFLLITIPGILTLWFIHIQATVKRLHDLGKEEGEIFKFLIPVVGSFLHWRVHWQQGEKEMETEYYMDYQRQQYDKRMRNRHPDDDY